ncbi:MAG: cell division regulator GpsB [Bacillota bacterium]|nr:cell division regulator GpsB [Bacillota bacterium]
MAKELNLTAKDIYDKEFHVDVRGFSCEEVDEFLDQIIEDYQLFEEKIAELGKALARYEEKNKELQQTIQTLQKENQLAAETSMASASVDQVDILKRIARLEAAVFNAEGNE